MADSREPGTRGARGVLRAIAKVIKRILQAVLGLAVALGCAAIVSLLIIPAATTILTTQGSSAADVQATSAASSTATITDAAAEEEEEEPEATTVTISFAGDCTLGMDENASYSTSFNAMYESVDDPSWFFANVYDIFSADDLTVVNMEGTLTEALTRADKTYAFKGDAEYAQVLVQGGVEAASMANNHSHDYGSDSYTDTIEALEDAGISTFGYDSISYQEVNGVTVALIGTYELASGLSIQSEMVENIQAAQEAGADIICVYIHWGEEYETTPNETQVKLGHIAIDAGADLVVGSHPHIIQGYEKYNGRYIVYSLGNFCFGGNSNPSDKDCYIFQQTFTIVDGEIVDDDNITVIPCTVSSTSERNNYQPTPATGDEAERILEKIQERSEAAAELSASLGY